MKSINERLSATTQTRMLVVFVFMVFCIVVLLIKHTLGTESSLVTVILEKSGLLCVLFVGGKSVTDAVRAYKNGCDDGKAGKINERTTDTKGTP